jgi:hypothetical protein
MRIEVMVNPFRAPRGMMLGTQVKSGTPAEAKKIHAQPVTDRA